MRLPPRPVALPRALSLAMLVWAAACSDAPTASRAALPTPRHDGSAAVATLRRPTLVPNRVKYRDAGHHPATGRAGSASLYLQALLGHDGKTEVQVATSEWAFLYGWAPGEITQLQVKALGQDGHVIATRVHTTDLPGGGAATLTYGGMARGTTLRAQGTVRGIDARRTDVPVVTGAVRLRPNLAVKGIVVPERVREGRYAVVAATIMETNGDLGEWSECRLYVDGQPVDWAQGIWVDAGDAVTCLFSVGFVAEGRHRVEVRLGTGSPRDDDPTDNAASAEVEVYASNELFYTAAVNGYEVNTHTFTRNTWFLRDSAGVGSPEQYRERYQDDMHSNFAHRVVSLSGWAYKAMSQRPRVEVEEESDGVQLFSRTYDLEPLWWDPGSSCGQGVDGASGVNVTACTTSDPFGGYTSVSYFRLSTRATYHSVGFSRTFDGATGEEQVYHYNFDSEHAEGLPLPELGSDYTVRVRLDDGTTQLLAASTFPLQKSEYRIDLPLNCTESYYPSEYWWAILANEYCVEWHLFTRDITGFGQSFQ